MTREEHYKNILSIKSPNILLELPTGFGKSKVAIDLIKHWYTNNNTTTLIIVPKLVLIQNWKDELKKWGHKGLVTFTTYASLHKYINKNFDVLVYDECQHFTERIASIHTKITCTYSLFLSATVTKEIRQRLYNCTNLYSYKVSARKAIDDNILPDPRVILVEMHLSQAQNDKIIIYPKKPSTRTEVVTWNNRRKYLYKKNKNFNLIITCSEQQHYAYLSEQIEFWKKRYMQTNSIIAKNKWLHNAGIRLKWLSKNKQDTVLYLLNLHKNDRVLTFCADINQTEELGKYCINSKNKQSKQYYDMFNEGKINHITACGILNEGVNITNCQYGIFAYLSSSDIIIKQRLGRLLRHKNPVIIIPYYAGTREQEIVEKMLKDYNPNLVEIKKYN